MSKRLALFFPLFLLAVFFASAQKSKPNPIDFPLTVQVTSSRAVFGYGSMPGYQLLEAVIGGRQAELMGGPPAPLVLGSYPARLSSKVHAPKNHPSYDICQIYDLLMPDGQFRSYQLTGLGRGPANP